MRSSTLVFKELCRVFGGSYADLIFWPSLVTDVAVEPGRAVVGRVRPYVVP
jgi:hypothetical protein